MKGYWKLVAEGEPFRLLFPLGTLIGIFGVLMWPLFYWFEIGGYPGPPHARIMIEGFLSSFVVGFLATAMPRLLGTPRLTLIEALGFAAALVGVVWLQFTNQPFRGDILFLIILTTLVVGLLIRSFYRKDVPPPAFTLVIFGVSSAWIGAVLQILVGIPIASLPFWVAPLSKLLLYQGYLLFPIMGIGAFVLPRFFGLPCTQDFPESLALPPGWMKSAAFAASCGLFVLLGFVLEAVGRPGIGCAMRAIGIFVYFFHEVPVHKARFSGGSLASGLRIAFFAIPVGYLLIAFNPTHLLTWAHVVFITGFSLLTFIVATRVVLGHSGRMENFNGVMWPIRLMIAFIVIAMLARITADFIPAAWIPSGDVMNIRLGHYAYAGIFWTIGVLIWAITILPGVVIEDPDDDDE